MARIYNENVEDRECYRDYVVDIRVPEFSEKIVHSKIVDNGGVSYKIYNYDQDILCFDDQLHGRFRSVVFSHPENKLLSFSPPKSIDNDTFMKNCPAIYCNENIEVCEKVEGVMINLFFDSRIKKWEISTKTNVGGDYGCFIPKNNPLHVGRNSYSHIQQLLRDSTSRKLSNGAKKTAILSMFLDALQCSHDSVNDCAWINEMDVRYSYSFVLQHPENEITQKVNRPRLVLVAVYDIDHINHRAIEIPSHVYESWPLFLNILGIVDFPEKVKMDDRFYDCIQKKYCSHYSTYASPGVVIKNYESGERTVFENIAYTELLRSKRTKLLPMLLYQYLCLQRINKMDDFLKYFGAYRKQMQKFQHLVIDFVKTLHQAYMDVHVLKIVDIEDINNSIAPHVNYLHKNVYLRYYGTGLAKKITRDVVRTYVESMEPREILYLLMHHRRTMMQQNSIRCAV